ncbi:MAG: hypothetical protein ACRDO9_13700, partial [Gaiellales bacterium]
GQRPCRPAALVRGGNAMNDLELDVAESFERVFPVPVVIEDWHDVVGRAGVARQGKVRPSSRRRLLVLAAAALVVAVGTGSAFGIRAFILDKGFIGLPPEGATPSAPQGGELVLKAVWRSLSIANHVQPGEDWVGAEVRTWVYAAGRVIWQREGAQTPEGATELRSGLLEQRLTPEGLELLRSEIVATGLFEHNLALDVPQFDDLSYGVAEIRRDDRLVSVEWNCPGAARCEDATATPEQASALRRLDALLSDPVSVLASSAWAVREIRAYVPSHYAVCVETSPPTNITPLLSRLPARAEELLRDQNWARSEGDIVEAREGGVIVVLGRAVTYCSKLTTEEAREVDKALSGLDPDPTFPQDPLGYLVAEAVENRDGLPLIPTAIRFQPYLPHGQAGNAWNPGG